jgi:dGTPase
VADVFAYIGRDIEDAITLGLIKRQSLPADATRVLGSTNRDIINRLAIDVIGNSYGYGAIRFSVPVFNAMQSLLHFNYEQIYKAKVIQREKAKLKKVVQELFHAILGEARRRKSLLFQEFLKSMPPAYQDETPDIRIVADFIAGMTDTFLLRQYMQRFVPMNLGYRLGR